MPQTCRKCSADNPPMARFCQNCGQALGATLLQARTITMTQCMSPAPLQMDVKTIVDRARAAFGSAPILSGPQTDGESGQRELTFHVTDVSGSMGDVYDGTLIKLEAAKRADVTMVVNKYAIDPDDEIGLISFNHAAQVCLGLRPMAAHKHDIIASIQALQVGGGTDINAGLKAARENFDWGRTGVVRRIVLLTDGEGGDPIQTAEDLKARGVVIDVVGVGADPSGVNEKLLRKVASVIQGEIRYRFIKDHQTLVAHYTRLAGKTATGV